MTTENKLIVYHQIFSQLSNILDITDARQISENVIDDITDDIDVCADIEFNDSDIRLALGRVLKKRLNIEE